ncbi:hypothetical protein D046_2480A, partial [Vibrio parahaemolyticus V-223/04]
MEPQALANCSKDRSTIYDSSR